MKTTLSITLLSCLMLINAVAFAQPTLTANGCNPIIGESMTHYVGSYLQEGGSGANQTWNFSALSGSQGTLHNAVAPSSTTYGSSFPNATIALEASSTGVTAYYQNSASAQRVAGVVTSMGAIMPYSNLEDLIRFPFTMGNTFSDTWATQFVSGGFDFYRTGVTTVTADAYGTMITPAGTFTNVLRVHFVQVYRDSANFGVPYFIDYDNDQYLWYKDGVHWPVATTFILTSTTATFANATYTTAGPVGIDQGSDLLASASLFPNPAAEQLTLDLNLTKDQNLDILIFNGIGQEVRNLASQKCNQGTNRIQLEVDDLPEGIYFAKVMVSGSTAVTKRFVVAR